ncbi:MAG: hypothetical protein ACR2HF_07090, partial [Methylococcaceae bacterium]
MLDRILLKQRVVDMKNGSPRVAKKKLHALFFETLDNDFCAAQLHSSCTLLIGKMTDKNTRTSTVRQVSSLSRPFEEVALRLAHSSISDWSVFS